MRPKFHNAVNGVTPVAGFTLIELSLVLVIIGLIVGGILVGQDLIRAAEIRAQISQIEKYQTAANTFRGKYNALPGDLNAATATQYGFMLRGSYAGQGDGNGLLEGAMSNDPLGHSGINLYGGETAMFWVDLSKAQLIDDNFTTASPLLSPALVSATQVGAYFPEAKLGRGNYVAVWSGGWLSANGHGTDGINYLSVASFLGGDPGSGAEFTTTTMTVQQAYGIDKKMDDGLPQSGRVMAMYYGMMNFWAAGGNSSSFGQANGGACDSALCGPVVPGDGIATAADATTCYDNGNVPGATEHYSLGFNAGANPNCALSFQFQ